MDSRDREQVENFLEEIRNRASEALDGLQEVEDHLAPGLPPREFGEMIWSQIDDVRAALHRILELVE